MRQIKAAIAQASTILQQAKHLVVLTGAGISTPSGIPDFRGENSGVWQRVDPMEVASIYAFRRNPQDFYSWIHPLTVLIAQAKPNAAHVALAEMESHGVLKCIITQNIDMLHSKAGSRNVYEVHGHMREMSCMQCESIYDSTDILASFIKTKLTPTCPACEGVLKPNVILFGEMLPMQVLHKAQTQTIECDVMLVAGSSLEVSPVSNLPVMAKQNGAKLIFVNLDETQHDSIADVMVHANVVDVLPQLATLFRN